MTITGYSNAIVDTMLGWLKGFANWVLKLFNLAGSSGGSPLLWLSQNWLKLLVVLMIVGVSVDILVWLVRWRPHWVWFRKLRVIVDDDRFFNEADIQAQLHPDDDEFLEKNWEERDYVVASTVVNRHGPRERAADSPVPGKRRSTRRPERRVDTQVQRGEKRRRPRPVDHRAERRQAEREQRGRRLHSEREADLFGLDGSRPGVTDFYEDEVFNVNNLPQAEDNKGE